MWWLVFYTQFTSRPLFIHETYNNSPYERVIIPPVRLGDRALTKAKITKDIDNTILENLDPVHLPTQNTGIGNSFEKSPTARFNNSYKQGKTFLETHPASPGGGMGSPIAFNRSSSSKNSAPGSGSSGVGLDIPSSSSSNLSGPMSVPYNNPPTNTRVLIDTGNDPDQATRIPAGEGWWILLLLSAVYVKVRTRFFRKV